MKSVSVTFLLLALLLTGCGSPDGNTWLVRTSSEELTIAEAGNAWLNLDAHGKQVFAEKDDAVGEFILALGRKSIITLEVSCDEYLYSPEISALRELWLRTAAAQTYRQNLSESVRNALTDKDLENYRELIGSIVWYTDDQGISHGPLRLPDIPWDIAFALDTLAAGESVSLTAGVFKLDSAVVSPDSMIAVTLEDTAAVNNFALSSLTDSRVARSLDSLAALYEPSIVFDSTAVERYCSDRDNLEQGAILVSWNNGELTAEDFDEIVSFTAIGFPVAPDSPSWVKHTLSNHIRLIETESVLLQNNPESYAELQEQADDFAMEQATDALYHDMVASQIAVTDEMILDSFNSLDSIPLIPETRTFYSVMVPSTLLDTHMEAMARGLDLTVLGQPGYPDYLEAGEDHLSRPVLPDQIPERMAISLFLIEETDTLWQRPVEIEEGVFVFYRLASVIPPHEATLEQMTPVIQRNLTQQLMEQRTTEWLMELEQKYNLEINCDIISDLPSDPGLWADL
ncbi:hypothetical protein CSA37_12340 [Candidatus Fermentibacteria bacterium]|nr:MAG: hypothetical protein CSA37_12340 [Candidatus Fermentibacteria bacterium]